METNQSTGNRSKKIFIAALIAMAIINGVTLYFLFNEKHEKETIIVEKTSLEGDYKSTMDALETKKLEMEQLTGRNAEMDKQIAEQIQMIEQTKSELTAEHDKNTLTSAQLNNAWAQIKEYRASVASLQKQVAEYEVKTQQLTTEKIALTEEVVCQQETNTQLTATNQVLTHKVDEGSFLQLPSVKVEAIKRKNNGQEVAVAKVKAAESLKVSFETGVNKVLDKGTVPLYVRIINPRGETMAVTEQGSGIIPETESGKPVQYTKKANIQYSQSNKKVTVYWTRNINTPGTYRVEIYQNGRIIGKTATTLS